ncbi:Ubiquitin carboxyl-terminal hydrolase [Trichophyton interdigitale]|uniref:Ubiquitin carboxyl-terminal hydrolase n=1 Tax=Trichophyton interdigitale TaxID=101480 RepID=A0A9P4YK29_9EURO|nr:Ubiquitin carboxyl-terminal hydrolase [Trichophyton interdigitale]KAF3899418.1 Ubiquitin carboxyl-terminal hydrolase [Trichophyton interdigitale]KAG8210876.1 Ubiquitin carboxyl-terminal hydrolase [Trichophyton interdigitale]
MDTAGLAFRPKGPAATAKPLASDREILDTLMQLCWQNYCLSATISRHKSKLTTLGRFQIGLAYKRKSLVNPFSVEVVPAATRQILLYPQGNGVDKVSIYFQRYIDTSLPSKDWHACVQFALVLWDPKNPSNYVSHAAAHRFNAEEPDWGFTKFCERKKPSTSLETPGSPFSGTEGVKITAYVRVIKDPTGLLWHNFVKYDSKSVTGLVGVSNLGATDYLSCVVQNLYHISLFRKIIYQAPTAIHEPTDKAWALQHVFCLLHTKSSAISPVKLTDSFGWRAMHLFEPQDAQEFSSILLSCIEKRLRVSPCRDTFQNLFTIRGTTNLSAIKVSYEWSKEEEFTHVELNVRGHRTLMDSFKDYTSAVLFKDFYTGAIFETKDVIKRNTFSHLPWVLTIYLNRVEFDVNAGEMKKITDYHEFPEEIDMSPYLSSEADKSQSWDYILFGVVVHASGPSNAHYYTFIRPKPDGHFYKFDDDRVTLATMKEAMNDNFGVLKTNQEQPPPKVLEPYYNAKKYQEKTATMLIYIRKSEVNRVLADVLQDEIPTRIYSSPSAYTQEDHLEDFFGSKLMKEGAAAINAQSKELKANYTNNSGINVRFFSINDFYKHHGLDIVPKLPTDDKSASSLSYSHLQENVLVQELVSAVTQALNIPGKAIRIWPMITRQNGTLRPIGPPLDPGAAMGDVRKTHYPRLPCEFQLWVESDGCLYGDRNGPDSSLVFLKHFDVIKQAVTGFSSIYVKPDDKPDDLSPMICRAMEWEPNTPISYYEEIKPTLIDKMDGKNTMKRLEIGDGDIICFQRVMTSTELSENIKYDNARDFYFSGLVE